MENLYPASPTSVPASLTNPTATYKRGVWLAFFCLILFIALYVSLTGWFVWKAYYLMLHSSSGGDKALLGFGFAIASAFFAVFLIKGLFFINRGGESDDLEITQEQEPQLFDFLHRLADEAQAPKPHRVFLSNRVNAAVFYNLSLLNLIMPSKKNLEIGLPLVNTLTLCEFKAVLAHEFGHFRQGSMAIGTWVYTAQQIATHIIHARGIFDNFLNGLSRFDIRLAWIGWILRLVVWSLRAVLDTVFSLVTLAQRSLSREMEFQADLVSASLTGSDSLVHALHKLHAADNCWERAMNFSFEELQQGRAIEDAYVVQRLTSRHIRKILDDDCYDQAPPIPNTDPAEHRVFKENSAHPPRMWSTHPENFLREENVKNTYIASHIDDRSPWDLFQNPTDMRKQATRNLLGLDKLDADTLRKISPSSSVDAVKKLNEQYAKFMYNRRYHGTYLGRSVVRHFKTAKDMLTVSIEPGQIAKAFSEIYPKSFSDDVEHWRNLLEEKQIMAAIKDRRLKTSDGVVRHRGETVKRKDIPRIIQDLDREAQAAQDKLADIDAKIRSVHFAAAQKIGEGWSEHIEGLVSLLHYAEHTRDNMVDARGELNNIWAVITADGKISSGERKTLMSATSSLYSLLVSADSEKAQVKIGLRVAKYLEIEKWTDILSEEFNFAAPDEQNIGDWLNAVDSWLDYFINAFAQLSQSTLEVLLESETHVENCFLNKTEPGSAPEPGSVPDKYQVLLPGDERELQTKLDFWDSFQTGTGFFPSAARMIMACSIVGGIFGFGFYAGSASVVVYNGLATSVRVEIGGSELQVPAFSSRKIKTAAGSNTQVIAYHNSGDVIEQFSADASNTITEYVYNVASASPLIEWTEVYGSARERAPRFLGSPRWINSNADHLFSDPPESIQTSGSGATRDILGGFGDTAPAQLPNLLPNNADVSAIVNTHARWDSANSLQVSNWLYSVDSTDDLGSIIQHRLQRNPDEILSLRLEQDATETEADHDAVCSKHTALAKSVPENQNWQYIATRCIENDEQKNLAFLQGQKQASDHAWFAYAAGYVKAEQEQWQEAVEFLTVAFNNEPSLKESTADTILRIQRLQGTLSSSSNPYFEAAPSLYWQYNVEQGNDIEDAESEAYHLLSRGKLSEALSTVDDEERHSLLRLAAASDGASQVIIDAALKLTPEQGANANTLWPTLALLKKYKADDSAYRVLITESKNEDFQTILDIMDGLESGKKLSTSKVNEINRQLELLTPLMKGYAYTVATIVLEKQTPTQWRHNAHRLLFSAERPFFVR